MSSDPSSSFMVTSSADAFAARTPHTGSRGTVALTRTRPCGTELPSRFGFRWSAGVLPSCVVIEVRVPLAGRTRDQHVDVSGELGQCALGLRAASSEPAIQEPPDVGPPQHRVREVQRVHVRRSSIAPRQGPPSHHAQTVALLPPRRASVRHRRRRGRRSGSGSAASRTQNECHRRGIPRSSAQTAHVGADRVGAGNPSPLVTALSPSIVRGRAGNDRVDR